MNLYDCTVAPNPRRVRIFVAEKGINIPKIEIDIVGGENLKDEFRSINPRGLLPVLELARSKRHNFSARTIVGTSRCLEAHNLLACIAL